MVEKEAFRWSLRFQNLFQKTLGNPARLAAIQAQIKQFGPEIRLDLHVSLNVPCDVAMN
jgi:hypothetical protein